MRKFIKNSSTTVLVFSILCATLSSGFSQDVPVLDDWDYVNVTMYNNVTGDSMPDKLYKGATIYYDSVHYFKVHDITWNQDLVQPSEVSVMQQPVALDTTKKDNGVLDDYLDEFLGDEDNIPEIKASINGGRIGTYEARTQFARKIITGFVSFLQRSVFQDFFYLLSGDNRKKCSDYEAAAAEACRKCLDALNNNKAEADVEENQVRTSKKK